MKTTLEQRKQWLASKGALESFEKNLKENIEDLDESNFFFRAFDWSSPPEGINYWGDLNEEYLEWLESFEDKGNVGEGSHIISNIQDGKVGFILNPETLIIELLRQGVSYNLVVEQVEHIIMAFNKTFNE